MSTQLWPWPLTWWPQNQYGSFPARGLPARLSSVQCKSWSKWKLLGENRFSISVLLWPWHVTWWPLNQWYFFLGCCLPVCKVRRPKEKRNCLETDFVLWPVMTLTFNQMIPKISTFLSLPRRLSACKVLRANAETSYCAETDFLCWPSLDLGLWPVDPQTTCLRPT